MINVKDYGAKGDGSSIDTAAINGAASKALAEGQVLYFPGGIYLLDSRLDLSGKPISICGDGKALTRLVWNSVPGGIQFIGSGVSANDITVFSIEKLTLATTTLGGIALRLEWPIMFANPQKKTRIHDVEIRGWDQYGGNLHGWQCGIWLTNPGGLDISHSDVLGKEGFSEVGIKCDSPIKSGAIRHFLSNIYILRYDIGIDFEGPNEGIYFNNFEIVGCRFGFRAVGGGTVYHISNGHADCRTTGMAFSGQGEVKLHNIAFFHTSNGGNRTDGNLVLMENGSRFTVSNCSFYGFKSDLPALGAQNGILAAGCTSGLVVSNHFDQIKDAAILFGTGTIDCHSVANRTSNCGGRYINLGAPSNTDNSL
jgi:Pectate lyase superfamily protein